MIREFDFEAKPKARKGLASLDVSRWADLEAGHSHLVLLCWAKDRDSKAAGCICHAIVAAHELCQEEDEFQEVLAAKLGNAKPSTAAEAPAEAANTAGVLSEEAGDRF